MKKSNCSVPVIGRSSFKNASILATFADEIKTETIGFSEVQKGKGANIEVLGL